MAIICLSLASEAAPKIARKPSVDRVRKLNENLEAARTLLARIHEDRRNQSVAWSDRM